MPSFGITVRFNLVSFFFKKVAKSSKPALSSMYSFPHYARLAVFEILPFYFYLIVF